MVFLNDHYDDDYDNKLPKNLDEVRKIEEALRREKNDYDDYDDSDDSDDSDDDSDDSDDDSYVPYWILSATAWKEIGYEYDRRGELHDALEAFCNGLGKNPKDYEILVEKGIVLRKLNRLNEALAAFEEVIMNEPENRIAWAGKTDVLSELNRTSEWLSARHKVNQLDRSNISGPPLSRYTEKQVLRIKSAIITVPVIMIFLLFPDWLYLLITCTVIITVLGNLLYNEKEM